ncbi:MAG: hypothetical protein Q7O04_00450 [Candidatus Omnitrophota bacterium]|nr:hypothetical protein [Candidatus Omnitrophota bacterium]
MVKIKKVFNLKILSLFLIIASISISISYGLDIKSSLRKPLIFSAVEPDSARIKSATFIEALKYKDPWQIARESGNLAIPLFVSTEHATTYTVIYDGIEKGNLIQGDIIVINFDKHNDMVNDIDYPWSNNWIRILLDRGMIADRLWFNREDNKIEDFGDIESLNGKAIVISIDIDYFDDIIENERQNAVNEIVDFMKNHGLDIRVVSVALSPDYCFNINPENVADELCSNIGATLVSYQWYVSRFSYLLKYGLCANVKQRLPSSVPGLDKTLKEVRGNL